MLFADLLSLYFVTFLMFFILVHVTNKRAQVQLECAMVGESCLLEKAGSKRHVNYTLE